MDEIKLAKAEAMASRDITSFSKFIINQALQEKQEREKGCEYCDETFYKYEYEPFASEPDCLESINNNFCPMCGRKLGEKHE